MWGKWVTYSHDGTSRRIVLSVPVRALAPVPADDAVHGPLGAAVRVEGPIPDRGADVVQAGAGAVAAAATIAVLFAAVVAVLLTVATLATLAVAVGGGDGRGVGGGSGTLRARHCLLFEEYVFVRGGCVRVATDSRTGMISCADWKVKCIKHLKCSAVVVVVVCCGVK